MGNFGQDLRLVADWGAKTMRTALIARNKKYKESRGMEFGFPYEKEYVGLLFHLLLKKRHSQNYTVNNLGMEWFWEKKRGEYTTKDHPDLIFWRDDYRFEVVEVKLMYSVTTQVSVYSTDVDRIQGDYDKLIDMRRTDEIAKKYLVVAYVNDRFRTRKGKSISKFDKREFEKILSNAIDIEKRKVHLVVC